MTDHAEEKGFGFHPHSEERKRQKLEHRLTRHLLEKCTHEELARSTARLILEQSVFREAIINAASEIARDAATHAAVSAANTAIFAFKSHTKATRKLIYEITLGPLAERSAAAQEAAKNIARELWKTEPLGRMGDVADKVYRQLVGTEHETSLPISAEQIRDWIRGVAPPAASRPGRPRKTP